LRGLADSVQRALSSARGVNGRRALQSEIL